METFFGIHSVLESIIEFLLLNVLPGLDSDLHVSSVFFPHSFYFEKQANIQGNRNQNVTMRLSFT